MNLNNVEAIILCGGRGTRLQPVLPNTQKTMVKIGNKVFLDFVIENFKKQGVKKFILCVSYFREQVKEYFKNRKDIKILFSEEETPFGTGGAVKKAMSMIQNQNMLVVNGDNICKVDLKNFFQEHLNNGAVISMVLAKSDRKDAGQVLIDKTNKIISFNEKKGKTGLINAGIYFINKKALNIISSEKFSLETDLFPKIDKKKFFGYKTFEKVIDIGTPERLFEFSNSQVIKKTD